jgi:hypothetical protein
VIAERIRRCSSSRHRRSASRSCVITLTLRLLRLHRRCSTRRSWPWLAFWPAPAATPAPATEPICAVGSPGVPSTSWQCPTLAELIWSCGLGPWKTTNALDAGVPLRDVRIATRHADPRTTTRYDRARHNLDRHASYIVTAFVAGAA